MDSRSSDEINGKFSVENKGVCRRRCIFVSVAAFIIVSFIVFSKKRFSLRLERLFE
jgi:hypothetical protein